MRSVCSLIIILPIVLSPVFLASAGTTDHDVDMTIRQVAHDTGLKGRELAELLGLDGTVDKDTALAELGVTQEQLDAVLAELPSPEPAEENEHQEISIEMTLQEAAHAMGIKGHELAHDLVLPVDADKTTPLKELGVKESTLAEAVKHAAHEKETGLDWLKYPLWAMICAFAVFLLMRRRASKAMYLSTLAFSLTVTGFALGKAPNPMESVSKIFKASVGIYPDVIDKVVAFIFFCALAVVGNKVICGWGCPFGALQELLFETPMGETVKRIREKKLPFKWTNLVRAALFVLFVFVMYGIVGNKKGLVTYHYINAFNLFDFDFTLISVVIAIVTFILLSPFVYRSFCQFICPFGIISWVLEKFSITRVTINRGSCTECKACVKACPLEAMKGRVAGSSWPADCFSCARCLRTCEYDALDYKGVWERAVNSDQ
jgi:NAD-dependent dihydropyrimidine dehydrogenase PreA subunit